MYTNVHVLVLNILNEDDSFPKKICFHCKVKRLDSAVQEVSRTCVVFRQLSKKDQWAIALNFCTPGVEEQWNSSGVSYKSCGILQGLSQKSWNSLGVKH